MRLRYALTFCALVVAADLFGQAERKYCVTIGENMRTPLNTGLRIFAPVVLNKNLDKKILLGGFSVGLSYFTRIATHLELKSTVNFSRQVYWNEPVVFNKGPNPQDVLGITDMKTTEYYTSLSSVMHFAPRKRFSGGVGLGVELMLSSASTFLFQKRALVQGISGNTNHFKNSEFKPVMPVVPVELSWKGDKMLYNFRFEAGLMNRYRGELTSYGPNFFGLISWEVGMRI